MNSTTVSRFQVECYFSIELIGFCYYFYKFDLKIDLKFMFFIRSVAHTRYIILNAAAQWLALIYLHLDNTGRVNLANTSVKKPANLLHK